MPDIAAILVVDDDPVQRDHARLALTSAGWTVTILDRGEDAVAALAARHHMLVLVDIEMPGMDGFETARAIRASGDGAASVPILAFTSLALDGIAVRMKAAGMDGYLAKPCPADRLIAQLAPWMTMPGHGWERQARLEQMIGPEDFRGLLDGLSRQIAEALAAFDQPGLAARAHRLAGLAGTLGFSDVSNAWIGLANGDGSTRVAARMTARRALRTIQRRIGSA